MFSSSLSDKSSLTNDSDNEKNDTKKWIDGFIWNALNKRIEQWKFIWKKFVYSFSQKKLVKKKLRLIKEGRGFCAAGCKEKLIICDSCTLFCWTDAWSWILSLGVDKYQNYWHVHNWLPPRKPLPNPCKCCCWPKFYPSGVGSRTQSRTRHRFCAGEGKTQFHVCRVCYF